LTKIKNYFQNKQVTFLEQCIEVTRNKVVIKSLQGSAVTQTMLRAWVYLGYCWWWCFLTAYTYLICHNKTGYMGTYALTVNKSMCTAPCHTKLLKFFLCTFCSTCNAYLWEAPLVYHFWEQHSFMDFMHSI